MFFMLYLIVLSGVKYTNTAGILLNNVAIILSTKVLL